MSERAWRGTAGRILAGLALVTAVSCAREPERTRVVAFEGPTMGASWSVRLVWPGSGEVDPEERARLQRSIQATLTQIDRLMSTWDATSELSHFNASTSLDRFPVAPETFDVFRSASLMATETGGAMDATVLPLVDAWGFGATRSVPLPDEATVARLRADVGMANIELDPAGAWVRKRRPGVRVTFSAIAPGYAADRVAALLTAAGYARFLVDIGGEMVARGHNAEGLPWQVGVERPSDTARSFERIVSLHDQAIATSGDYRNYRDGADGRLPHILDPRSGRPVHHALASVTVLAPEAVRADALSTALMVMGPDEAMAFARARNLPALLLVRTATGQFEERASPAFADRVR